jgi:amino acid transporter
MYATQGVSGFWAAIILGMLAFSGFDVIATAAEEAQAPRDHVPRVLVLAVIAIALFWAANASLGPAVQFESSRLPDLPPGCEFRGTDSIAREITFMQADELRFGQLDETPAAAGIDFFLRPSRYSR